MISGHVGSSRLPRPVRDLYKACVRRNVCGLFFCERVMPVEWIEKFHFAADGGKNLIPLQAVPNINKLGTLLK